MKKNAKKFAEISLNSHAHDLNHLNKTFKNLDDLNKILREVLPHHLHNACHIGAIDTNAETVVLFVSNQQSFHLVRNFNEAILNALIKSNFNFQKILVRVSVHHPEADIIYRGELDPKRKASLGKLANEIGKPELIQAKILQKASEANEDELTI